MSKPTRKVRDKWRLKEWYSVYSPTYFGEKNIADIPCEDPAKVIGRVVDTTLYDITGDFAHQSIKLYLLIYKVDGFRADTILNGHEYAPDYLRSLVRRGSSRIDGIFDLTCKDRFGTRVSVVAFARDRIKTSQEHGIRDVMRSVLVEKSKNLDYSQFVQEMVMGKVGSEIYSVTKKVTPLRHVGIRKSKLLVIPEGLIQKPEKPAQVKSAEPEAESEEKTAQVQA